MVSVFVDGTRREGCQDGECVCRRHEEGGLPGWLVFVHCTRREGCQGGECVCRRHEEGGLPGW